MANPNPLQARLTRREKRREALSPMLELLETAATKAREHIGNDDPAVSLKAIHAATQCAMAYAKVYEAGELEARLDAIETVLNDEGDA